MDLFSSVIIVLLCVVAYIVGYSRSQRDEPSVHSEKSLKKASNSQYKKLTEDGTDEEALVDRAQPAAAETQSSLLGDKELPVLSDANAQRENVIKEQQAEIDRLVRSLTEFKKKEQKAAAEILYLKTKVTVPTTGAFSIAGSGKAAADHDLMSEEAFGELVNETYGHSNIHEELDEEELDKQINQQLL